MKAKRAATIAIDELPVLIAQIRGQGRTIGTLNGCFDVLHCGHLRIIEDAAAQSDVLICGLNSDLSVRRLKGAQRPICPEPERIAVLSAIRWIDYITVFEELDPIRLLELVRPDVHTNGSDYGLDCIEAPTVRKHGGRIHVVERVDAPSTTALLERIRALER